LLQIFFETNHLIFTITVLYRASQTTQICGKT